MEPKTILLLYSGGADSTLLLKMIQKIGLIPYCLGFNYGQVHVKELEWARMYCAKQHVTYKELSIFLPVHSKLTDGESIYEGVSPFHVPSRNLLFISYAASLAESMGIDTIWYGANYEDRINLFPDCYQEWVLRVNELLAINGSKKITVEAPLLGMTKETICHLLRAYDVKEDEIYSGYGL